MQSATRSVCVFLSSATGNLEMQAQTRALGHAIAAANMRLIYGGAAVGLMGMLADAALAAGATVVGVMPQSLVDREISHQRLSELHVVATMHERKAKMSELADGFLVLPGGFGTLEEAFEILTAQQIQLHHKPIMFLDTGTFWRQLWQFLQHAADVGVLRTSVLAGFRFTDNIEAALAAMTSSQVKR